MSLIMPYPRHGWDGWGWDVDFFHFVPKLGDFISPQMGPASIQRSASLPGPEEAEGLWQNAMALYAQRKQQDTMQKTKAARDFWNANMSDTCDSDTGMPTTLRI